MEKVPSETGVFEVEPISNYDRKESEDNLGPVKICESNNLQLPLAPPISATSHPAVSDQDQPAANPIPITTAAPVPTLATIVPTLATVNKYIVISTDYPDLTLAIVADTSIEINPIKPGGVRGDSLKALIDHGDNLENENEDQVKKEDEEDDQVKNEEDYEERTSNCDMCDYKPSSSLDLQRHLTSRHKIRLPCKQCDKTFKNSRTLMEHTKRYHKIIAYNSDILRTPLKNSLRIKKIRSINSLVSSKTPKKPLNRTMLQMSDSFDKFINYSLNNATDTKLHVNHNNGASEDHLSENLSKKKTGSNEDLSVMLPIQLRSASTDSALEATARSPMRIKIKGG